MKVAKAKLLLHQKKWMEAEDERLVRLREGLSQTYINSDDEDEDGSKWVLSTQQNEMVATGISRGNVTEGYRTEPTFAL
jgi:predicted RNA-binding protein with PUA domain